MAQTQIELFLPPTERQVEDTLFGRVLEIANGNANAVGTAVRKALAEKFNEFVGNRGRWIYLANKLTRRAKRAIRGATKVKQNPRTRA